MKGTQKYSFLDKKKSSPDAFHDLSLNFTNNNLNEKYKQASMSTYHNNNLPNANTHIFIEPNDIQASIY